MITLESELDALPAGSVVVSVESDDVGRAHIKCPDHHLAPLYGPWYTTGYEVPHWDVDLPAILVWSPK